MRCMKHTYEYPRAALTVDCVVFGFDEADLPKILEISKKAKTKITIFARAVEGSFVSKCKEWHF